MSYPIKAQKAAKILRELAREISGDPNERADLAREAIVWLIGEHAPLDGPPSLLRRALGQADLRRRSRYTISQRRSRPVSLSTMRQIGALPAS